MSAARRDDRRERLAFFGLVFSEGEGVGFTTIGAVAALADAFFFAAAFGVAFFAAGFFVDFGVAFFAAAFFVIFFVAFLARAGALTAAFFFFVFAPGLLLLGFFAAFGRAREGLFRAACAFFGFVFFAAFFAAFFAVALDLPGFALLFFGDIWASIDPQGRNFSGCFSFSGRYRSMTKLRSNFANACCSARTFILRSC